MNDQLQNQLNYMNMYNQLLNQYSTLASNYHIQAEENLQLYQQLQKLMQQKITLLQENVPTEATLPSPLPPPDPIPFNGPQELQQPHSQKEDDLDNGPTHRHRRQHRIYKCTYPQCSRRYRSSVSMNLHIKLKHNGGTKKERQAIAKLIIESEVRGEPKPEISLNFPPGFLEQFKKNYEYTKKYNM